MSDQALTMLGTIVGWLAAAVAAAALLGDWVRQRLAGRQGRRRCPKCWYDLSHTPGLTCSECGFVAKRERGLFKARRRWRLVGLAFLMLIGAYGLRVAPLVKQRGWVAAAPTTALIVLAPVLRPQLDVVEAATSYGTTPMPAHLSSSSTCSRDSMTTIGSGSGKHP